MTVTNRDRAKLARDALESFRRATECDYETASATCSATLCTSADFHNFDFEAALIRAHAHYAEEKAEDVNGNFTKISCRQCGHADELACRDPRLGATY